MNYFPVVNSPTGEGSNSQVVSISRQAKQRGLFVAKQGARSLIKVAQKSRKELHQVYWHTCQRSDTGRAPLLHLCGCSISSILSLLGWMFGRSPYSHTEIGAEIFACTFERFHTQSFWCAEILLQIYSCPKWRSLCWNCASIFFASRKPKKNGTESISPPWNRGVPDS